VLDFFVVEARKQTQQTPETLMQLAGIDVIVLCELVNLGQDEGECRQVLVTDLVRNSEQRIERRVASSCWIALTWASAMSSFCCGNSASKRASWRPPLRAWRVQLSPLASVIWLPGGKLPLISWQRKRNAPARLCFSSMRFLRSRFSCSQVKMPMKKMPSREKPISSGTRAPMTSSVVLSSPNQITSRPSKPAKIGMIGLPVENRLVRRAFGAGDVSDGGALYGGVLMG